MHMVLDMHGDTGRQSEWYPKTPAPRILFPSIRFSLESTCSHFWICDMPSESPCVCLLNKASGDLPVMEVTESFTQLIATC